MADILDYPKAKSQVISLLQASRTAYATAVDGSKRQFASDTEIEDAILFSDGDYCTAICDTPGHPFSNAFKLTSASLVNGDTLPSYIGRILNVKHCATTNGTFLQGVPAASREDILEMLSNPATYGTAAYQLKYYFIEDATLYIVNAFGRLTYTDYVRTAAPQAPQSYASGVTAGAVARLLKDGGDDAMANYYLQMHMGYLQSVRAAAKMLPAIVEYKR